METIIDINENKICKGDEYYKYNIGRETILMPRYNHRWELKSPYKTFNVYECMNCGITRKIITKQ